MQIVSAPFALFASNELYASPRMAPESSMFYGVRLHTEDYVFRRAIDGAAAGKHDVLKSGARLQRRQRDPPHCFNNILPTTTTNSSTISTAAK